MIIQQLDTSSCVATSVSVYADIVGVGIGVGLGVGVGVGIGVGIGVGTGVGLGVGVGVWVRVGAEDTVTGDTDGDGAVVGTVPVPVALSSAIPPADGAPCIESCDTSSCCTDPASGVFCGVVFVTRTTAYAKKLPITTVIANVPKMSCLFIDVV